MPGDTVGTEYEVVVWTVLALIGIFASVVGAFHD